ncbi:sulfite exporter TauE/SafE family protein [Clostridium tyrobutyricum]|uniref:Heavy-metal-associated domain (N-terminus) and membrane-bounded cytochrome biogenesis cycZ-like domain, possible membrane copper tolerance protein n=1 Tax=Clostridium tyrobutyricum DIVETGP TaxID=1408889 RepID=W6NFB5_CLOTY|nr:sulfite exporter TauE/SafE family protein [Clostridium tyrobutyricum]AND84742.1 heavy metal-binding domain-containing protein [Clostridium tyrobutyricum]ANP69335.1 heavy metal transporter [Clostridium tyrobutyricum]MBV4435165.1 sulfite exporter TauE/SafE family protein [Clostridium tyrobutyricum]MBV4449770.1 sulfite exporter TauE/SafE family protein [Clostridium tyrobutyricum]MCH4200529.1 sulfite exporter TauE/SafE family protein [Clostridium tyrobutyricum]
MKVDILENTTNNKLNKQKNKNIWIIISIMVVVLFIIILKSIFKINILEVLKNLFMLKYLPRLGNNTSYALLFIFGVMTSFHCIGMCGGITLSQTINKSERKIKNTIFRSSLFYNAGRILSYTIVGGIVGGLGSVISLSGTLRGIVPIIGGIFMIIMSINLLGIFKVLRRINITMPSFVARKVRRKNNYSPIIVGFLTGLMPCGPLQIIQLYALGTKSILLGAVSMFFFSIGTIPLLFTFGILNTFITKNFSKIILKFSAVLVLSLGVIMIGRGLSLYGISMGMKSMVSISGEGFSTIEGKNQNIKTELGSDTFPPIEVVKGVPVKWNLHVDEKNLNECNKAIQIPKYKIKKNLKVGDNIIEFIPYEKGEFMYTCWMGMIKSKITVVDNFSKLKQDQIKSPTN